MDKPYYRDEWVTQDCSDALNILPEIESESVDLLCTDPPYGISFMGKEWDKALPDIRVWKECYRVLKPGAFAFVMSIPRADCLSRMIISLEDAGFKVNFTPIFWAYASGFPKAQNIGKAVDKRRSCDVSDYINSSGKSDREIADYCGVSSALVRFWRLDERQIMSPEWNKLKNLLQIQNKQYDRNLEEAKRGIIGKQKNAMSGWNVGGSTKFVDRDITLASSPQAKALDGSYGGFQPKPAVEVIIVAMKPLSEKTFVDQALKNGKGITWLDDCRVPYESERDEYEQTNKEGFRGWKDEPTKGKLGNFSQSGRFPSNLLVSDDVLNDGRVIKSGRLSPNHTEKHSHWGEKTEWHTEKEYGGDSGSFSRYFDLDKWWAKTFPFLIVPKASKSEKNKGLGDLPDRETRRYGDRGQGGLPQQTPQKTIIDKNNHPTVKPLKLMSYLITLGSREGDIVLDLYSGSGTTLLASKLLNRHCIGIEIEEKYCAIAAKRCSQGVFNLTP